MKQFKCKTCSHGTNAVLIPDSTVETDLYGLKKLITRYYIECPVENAIDPILTENKFKYLVAFADDSEKARDIACEDWYYTFTDNYIDCYRIKDYYILDTIDELLEWWKTMYKHPLGMWYFMVHNNNGKLYTFCSGAVDKDDINSIIEYKKMLK